MSHDDDDLTDEERRQFAALARDRVPSDLLEERTVRALQSAGLLRAGGRSRWPRPALWAAGVAAAAALFVSGLGVGQWLGARNAALAIAAGGPESPLRAAMQVQRTGSAYAQALGTLASLGDSASMPERQQGREAALVVFYAAAEAILRLAPDDPVAGRILQGLDGTGDSATDARVSRVVWF